MTSLSELTVAEFSLLLPGPMAGAILAGAGAQVTKVEPPSGDPLHMDDSDSSQYAALNREKRILTLDLKQRAGLAEALDLVRDVDVVIEGFRPGVMARLGLGYEVVSEINPRVVYCSITGYGQTGPRAFEPGHDLNYQALSGMLALSQGPGTMPGMVPFQVADIAAGAYPAVINILMALIGRETAGKGAYLDISMTDNLFPLMFSALVLAWQGTAPEPGGELWTGSSPRYAIYRTADDRFLAVGAIEDKFWTRFCDLIGLDAAVRDDARDPLRTRAEVALHIEARTAAEWDVLLGKEQVCATVVRDFREAIDEFGLRSPRFFPLAGPG